MPNTTTPSPPSDDSGGVLRVQSSYPSRKRSGKNGAAFPRNALYNIMYTVVIIY